jgi:hypothetical protein
MGIKAATITGIGAPNPRALHEVPVHDPKVRIVALCVFVESDDSRFSKE